MPRTYRHALAISALATIALASLAASAPAPTRVQTTLVAAGPWLDRLNQWRASAGLPSLTEDSTWSAGDYNHAVYMVKNNLVTHYETPGTPYYTTAGDTAAQNGNIQVSSSTSTTDSQVIDWWMAAPFHAMAMMDPRLSVTGFGSYRDSTTSPWQEGAALDTLRGNSFSGGTYPVFFPGNGASEPLTTYGGGEFPNPLQACPGYSAPTGLPVFIEIGGNVNTSAGAHSFTGNGAALAHCVIDSSNSAVSSYLYSRGGVILVPQQPLQSGVKYVVSLTVNGAAHTWSFTVGPFTPTVTGVAPNSGPVAGGTSVTITGAGFSNGLTGVKFGATAAASFAVVNDTTVTAVSPAHAAGTVDVTVTTAIGTSPALSVDHFTYAPCTSVSATASPASPSTPGTQVTLTATAVGCSSPLYEFWYLGQGSSTWQLVQGYSATPSFKWNSTGALVGSHDFSVWVRDAASAGANTSSMGTYDAFGNTTYTIANQTCTPAASAAPGSPSPSGTPVTITAVASGCTNQVYEFWYLGQGSSTWQLVQGYSPSATYNWNSTGALAGSHVFSVWIRDASRPGRYSALGSTYDSYGNTTYAITKGAPCTAVTASAAPASPQAAGTTVTITATASGCVNPRYEFWILASGASWTVVQGYSSGNTFGWTTTGRPAGAYRYSVWVRDASSAAAYDTFFPGTVYSLS